MKIVIHGKALDQLGFSQQIYAVQGRNTPEVRHRSWACRPEELRSRQPRSRLRLEHQREIGDVAALERDHAGLWATCTLDADSNMLVRLSSGSWFYSVEIESYVDGPDRTDVELTGLGLVRKPAGVSLNPLIILPGELTPAQINNWHHLPRITRDRLHRAVDQTRNRNAPMLTVVDQTPAALELRSLEGRRADGLTPQEWQRVSDQYERPPGPLRHSAPYKGILSVR